MGSAGPSDFSQDGLRRSNRLRTARLHTSSRSRWLPSKLRAIDLSCTRLTLSVLQAGLVFKGFDVDQREFPDANGDGEMLPVPTPDAVTDLIVALSICAKSLDQLADEIVRCASCANDPIARQDLLAAARGQRIRVLEVQGMLAIFGGAFVERHIADQRP
jgi:hypothetical protein